MDTARLHVARTGHLRNLSFARGYRRESPALGGDIAGATTFNTHEGCVRIAQVLPRLRLHSATPWSMADEIWQTPTSALFQHPRQDHFFAIHRSQAPHAGSIHDIAPPDPHPAQDAPGRAPRVTALPQLLAIVSDGGVAPAHHDGTRGNSIDDSAVGQIGRPSSGTRWRRFFRGISPIIGATHHVLVCPVIRRTHPAEQRNGAFPHMLIRVVQFSPPSRSTKRLRPMGGLYHALPAPACMEPFADASSQLPK